MTTAPRLTSHQIRVAAFYWSAYQIGTLDIAEKLGVPEASVANSIEDIKILARLVSRANRIITRQEHIDASRPKKRVTLRPIEERAFASDEASPPCTAGA